MQVSGFLMLIFEEFWKKNKFKTIKKDSLNVISGLFYFKLPKNAFEKKVNDVLYLNFQKT